MALTESKSAVLNSLAPNFNLPGVDGKNHSLDSYEGAKALVVIFMCNHCPYVIATRDRMVNLQAEFKEKGVTFVGINSNDASNYPDDSFEKMGVMAAEIGMNFDYLFDETQEVAKAYGAVCTPDIFVFNKQRQLKYRGRIDDNWKEPKKVTLI